MSATVTSQHRAPERIAGLDAVLAVLLARHDQLDGDPQQQDAADSLRNGISMTCAITMVKMMRSSTAAPAPSRMPQKRCRGGSERQASAITTALSPESRMLIQMIWPTATQKAHCIMSAQR